MNRVVDRKITLSSITNVMPVSVAYMSARRKLEVRKTLYRNTKRISDAAQRMNQWYRLAAINLATQAAYVRFHDSRVRFEMNVPDVFEQHGPRHRLIRMLHQVFEQPKFARQQLDLDSTPHDRTGEQVYFQIRDLENGLDRQMRTSTSQCGDTRQKLCKGKWLDQIIIRARIQPVHPVIHTAQRRQKQNR